MIQKIKQIEVTKRVMYFGVELVVPKHTKYLAAHRNGHINAFAERPRYDDDDPHWWDGKMICTVATVVLDWADVKDSLVDVETSAWKQNVGIERSAP